MKIFSECMKSWVRMVNEGRYYTDVEEDCVVEDCVEEEQVYEGKKGKSSVSKNEVMKMAINHATDEIKNYFSNGAQVTKQMDEAARFSPDQLRQIQGGGKIQWPRHIESIQAGENLKPGISFLGDKGPSGTVKLKFAGDKDYTEFTVNGTKEEGEDKKNVNVTNEDVKKQKKKMGEKATSIDAILQAIKEKIGYDKDTEDDNDDSLEKETNFKGDDYEGNFGDDEDISDQRKDEKSYDNDNAVNQIR